jgi:hypothetical protein
LNFRCRKIPAALPDTPARDAKHGANRRQENRPREKQAKEKGERGEGAAEA